MRLKKECTALPRIAQYWDRRARGYALQVDKELEEHAQERYLSWFENLPSSGRILDVGCGPGFFSVVLAGAGFSVTALDASAGMIDQARHRASVRGVCIETVQGDAQALPFSDNAFDCVCSRNLVWNLEDPRAAYREWLRVLKPGGVMLVFDGNHYRYLFDERYERVHVQWQASSNHQMLGVDPGVIDAIAAELPLGRCVRPKWDVETLEALNADVESSVLATSTDPNDGTELVKDFVVRAVKKA